MPTNLQQVLMGRAAVSLGLKTNLIASWELNEASGNAVDAHTNALTLTDNNTVTSDAGVGGVGTARLFTAANTEYFSRTSETLLQTGDIDFTLAGWFYLTTKAANHAFITKDGNGAGQREYSLDYNASTDRFRFYIFTSPDIARIVSAGTLGAPSTGTWYFIVAWHDTTANTVNIQVDNGTADSGATTAAAQAASDALFCMGYRNYPAFNEPHNGRMQAVRFWKNRILTAAERTALYNGGVVVPYANL
jgi:hypothetical protein